MDARLSENLWRADKALKSAVAFYLQVRRIRSKPSRSFAEGIEELRILILSSILLCVMLKSPLKAPANPFMRDVRAGVQKWYRHMSIMIISHDLNSRSTDELSGRSSLSMSVIGESSSDSSLVRSKSYNYTPKLR